MQDQYRQKEQRQLRSRAGTVTAATAAATAGAALTGFLILSGPASTRVTAQDTPGMSAAQHATATSLEGAFMRIAETAAPATVSITAQFDPPSRRGAAQEEGEGGEGGSRQRRPPSDTDELPFGDLFGPFRRGPLPPRGGNARGSGVIVRPEGYILTNEHVVSGARDGAVRVTLDDGSTYVGKVSPDPLSDLALVKIDAGRPLPYIRMADSNKVRVGQWAIAIGSPFGHQNTMTAGIVSALKRKEEIGRSLEQRYYPNLIQTDASINMGNSGGPLLNIDGELIGVNVGISSPSGANAGIGFAIPANTAKRVAEQLISKGKVTRGFLGIVPDDIPAALRTSIGANTGARVKVVNPDTPAERAGIQAGDIVTRFGAEPVRSEIELRDAISATAPGAVVPMLLLRGGKEVTVSATVGALPEDPALVADAPRLRTERRPQDNKLQMRGEELTPDAARQMKLKADMKGVVVRTVAPGGPASEAGLEPRDIITHVNGKPVVSQEALNVLVRAAGPGDMLMLTVAHTVDESGKVLQRIVDVTIP